ncbi:flavin reductase family protein [Streptomyces sp. NPDC000594]|uniref:flavin reductase family protein n=1 Tax=Streptomyces sp. NPDC000594 TaxID=3154261 RepID=UPI003332838A
MGHAAMAETAVRYLRSARGPGAVGRPRARTPGASPGTSPGGPVMDPGEFRRVLGCFPSGVTVVTAHDEDGPAGFACQSFASLSLDPPLVVFLVGRTSATWPRIARAGAFCVNVLGAEQGALCMGFAASGADGRDKFAGVAYRASPATGSPLLAGVVAWVDCEVHAVHTGGDHLIVVGRALTLGTPPGAPAAPLLFHGGALRGLPPAKISPSGA